MAVEEINEFLNKVCSETPGRQKVIEYSSKLAKLLINASKGDPQLGPGTA